MIYPNTPQLRQWLHDTGFERLAERDQFDIDEPGYRVHRMAVQGRPVIEREDAAAYRCLTTLSPQAPAVVRQVHALLQGDISDVQAAIRAGEARHEKHSWIRFGITTLLLMTLILLSAIRGHAQQANVNPAVVLTSCGTAALTAGQRVYLTVATDGTLCINASVTVSGVVSVNNAGGGAAVNIQDGGNSITVDQPTAALLNVTEASASTIQSNTATIAAKDFATSAKQDTSNTTLATISGPVHSVGAPTSSLMAVGGVDAVGNVMALPVVGGAVQVQLGNRNIALRCNALRRTNCQ